MGGRRVAESVRGESRASGIRGDSRDDGANGPLVDPRTPAAGMEGTPMTDGRSKMLVAYHEIGHAVCATLAPGHDPVQKVRSAD